MPRGETAPIGARRKTQNGYWMTKMVDGWRYDHHVVAEKTLGRPVDFNTERVIFADRDPDNLDPANISVVPKREKLDGNGAKLSLEDKVDMLIDMVGELLGALSSQRLSLTNQV